MTEYINKLGSERLTKEYLSKTNCCDECFCEYWCIINGTKKDRLPYDGCEQNIINCLNELYDNR